MYLYGIEISKIVRHLTHESVLIVPLWNWNPCTTWVVSVVKIVLIVPLWNWNSKGDTQSHNQSVRFNCTFMELKLFINIWAEKALGVLIVPLWNWNIIVMGWHGRWKLVLIVPLWNWNRNSPLKAPSADCFNCTFMELKS